MSKSFVYFPPAELRPLVQDAMAKADAFEKRHLAEVRAELAQRGRATIRGWLIAKVRSPLTEDEAIDLSKKGQFWWLGLPEDHGYISDQRLFKRLLAACETFGAAVIQLHVDELHLINWWRKFEG